MRRRPHCNEPGGKRIWNCNPPCFHDEIFRTVKRSITDADLTTEILLVWRKERVPDEVKAFLEMLEDSQIDLQ